MKRHFSKIISLLVMLGSVISSSAAPIRLEIQMYPPVMSQKTIDKLISIQAGALIDDSQILDKARKIFNELQSLGYPLAEIDSISYTSETDPQKVTLFINCGPALTSVSEDSSINEINSSILELYAAELLDSLTESGYPFATIYFHPRQPIKTGDNLSIPIVPGIRAKSFYRIGGVIFPGGESLGNDYLLLESRLKIQKAFRQSDLSRSVENLEQHPAINFVSEPELREISPGILKISIPVITRSSTQISGIAALTPGASQPTGQLKFEVGNLFRGGRSASFSWYGLNPDRRGLLGSYREGWLFNRPIALAGELEGWQIKSSHSRTNYRLRASWEPFDNIITEISGSFERVTALANQTQSLGSTTRRVALHFELARFDSRWNPARGYSFSFDNARGWRAYSPGIALTTINSGRTKFETAIPINLKNSSLPRQLHFTEFKGRRGTDKWIGYVRVTNEFIKGENLLSDELPKFGGHSSVRGYTEDNFSGSVVLYGTSELRYRPDKHSGYFGLTSDAGWIVKQDPYTASGRRFAASLGITTTFRTELGLMSVDFAWPIDGLFEESRLHIALSGWL